MASMFTKNTFQLLKRTAEENRTIYYSELAGEVGGIARGMWQPLWRIWQFCASRDLPHLNALVVSKRTGLPGPGYTPEGRPVSHQKWRGTRDAVWAFDWSKVEID